MRAVVHVADSNVLQHFEVLIDHRYDAVGLVQFSRRAARKRRDRVGRNRAAKDGPAVPVAPLRLLWNLESRGFELASSFWGWRLGTAAVGLFHIAEAIGFCSGFPDCGEGVRLSEAAHSLTQQSVLLAMSSTKLEAHRCAVQRAGDGLSAAPDHRPEGLHAHHREDSCVAEVMRRDGHLARQYTKLTSRRCDGDSAPAVWSGRRA